MSDEDIHRAATYCLIAYSIEDDEATRELRLGFNTVGRLQEIFVLRLTTDEKWRCTR